MMNEQFGMEGKVAIITGAGGRRIQRVRRGVGPGRNGDGMIFNDFWGREFANTENVHIFALR
uniref:Uncharacterized protein n=1 Tax=termite gut metagenome TaxID=433724 RepID=S0DEG4_9ZZZZ